MSEKRAKAERLESNRQVAKFLEGYIAELDKRFEAAAEVGERERGKVRDSLKTAIDNKAAEVSERVEELAGIITGLRESVDETIKAEAENQNARLSEVKKGLYPPVDRTLRFLALPWYKRLFAKFE